MLKKEYKKASHKWFKLAFKPTMIILGLGAISIVLAMNNLQNIHWQLNKT